MGTSQTQKKGFEQPKILTPINKTPLEPINIDELISRFEKDPNEYKQYLQKICFVFDRNKQCDSSVNIIKNFIPNIKKLCKKILSVKKEQSHDKYMAFSCILGAFMGDALGDNCEFEEYNLENYKKILSMDGPWPPGEITDDSEMALSLAYAIMDSPQLNTLNQKYVFFFHGIWISTKPIAAGAATKNALKLFKYDEHTKLLYNETSQEEENNNKIMADIVETVQIINIKTLANGHLMRLSTFHVWFYYMNKEKIKEILKTDDSGQFFTLYSIIKKELIKDSCLTHPNEEMPIIASIFTFMVQCALFEYSSKDVLNKMHILLSYKDFDVQDSIPLKVKKFINDTLEDFKKPDFNKNVYFNNLYEFMGFYVHAIRLSLYYVYDFDNIVPMKGYTKFRSIMNDISNFGGDTDTNSAIVGQIIGPLIGFDNFGKKDMNKVLNHVSPSRFQYSASMVYFFVDYLEKNYNKPIDNNARNIPKFNFIRFLLKMVYCNDILKEIE